MIRLERVSIEQGEFKLAEIDLSVPSGGYATLMGASGVGKTTLLEAICGIRTVGAGRIFFENRNITRTPSSQRGIGFVPQDTALFPTMRVGQQIGFGLSVRKLDESVIKNRVEEVAKLIEIEDLLLRYPHELSGGQKRRVALARAIAFRPRLLCLDEPLESLDDPGRQRMVGLLKSIHQQGEVTVIHVTHNLAEALDLATLKLELTSNGIAEI